MQRLFLTYRQTFGDLIKTNEHGLSSVILKHKGIPDLPELIEMELCTSMCVIQNTLCENLK